MRGAQVRLLAAGEANERRVAEAVGEGAGAVQLAVELCEEGRCQEIQSERQGRWGAAVHECNIRDGAWTYFMQAVARNLKRNRGLVLNVGGKGGLQGTTGGWGTRPGCATIRRRQLGCFSLAAAAALPPSLPPSLPLSPLKRPPTVMRVPCSVIAR